MTLAAIRSFAALTATLLFALLVNPAQAQEMAPLAPVEEGAPTAAVAPQVNPALRIDPTKNFVLRYDIRAGALARPAYFGSDEYIAAPDFALHFDYARLRGLGEYGSTNGGPPRAVGIRGSLRFISARTSEDYEELEGLKDIDSALELGMGLVYRQKHFEAFGDARYGVIGHNGWAGELGVDAIAFPTDRWELRVGPRMSFGNTQFAETYFGVTDSEAQASGLSAFDAEGGLLGAGIEATARYRFNDLWGLEAGLRADRLLNSAADSPITEMGTPDQFRFRLGITRELVLQF